MAAVARPGDSAGGLPSERRTRSVCVLDRARTYREEVGGTFEEALAVTRVGNLFTTHTPVAAGLIGSIPTWSGIACRTMPKRSWGYPSKVSGFRQVESAGQCRAVQHGYLGVRGSGAVNGVSRLHGVVSRRIFQPLFPRWPQAEVPVGHVTNGVHTPTWDSAHADDLWTSVCGKDRWNGELDSISRRLMEAPETQLWNMRQQSRGALIAYLRKRLARQLAGHGAQPEEIEQASRISRSRCPDARIRPEVCHQRLPTCSCRIRTDCSKS